MEKKRISKYNSISYLNFPLSVNKKTQYIYNNLKKDEEEKNYTPILSSSIGNQVKDKSILIPNNKTDNNISLNKDEKNSSDNSPKETPEFNRNTNEKDEMLSNDLILDEINLKIDYEKIEKELSKYKSNNKNEESDLDNKNALRNTLNSNSIMEGDLFFYSDDEEELNKKIKSNNEKIQMIQENINKLDQDNIDNIDINNIDRINIKNMEVNKSIFEHKENYNVIKESKSGLDEKFLENIEYGIDETGNPIDIKKYKEEISHNINDITKKIIAYIIISKEKGKNHLIDLNGNIIPKREDGDFYYNYNGIHIIIKNFDVQNPKLRVFGARKRYSSIFYDDDMAPKGSGEEKPISPEDRKIKLFNQIKNKIYYKNKNIFKRNRQSPVLIRNNYRGKILNINNNKKTKKQTINIGLNKCNKNDEKKRISHYNKNKKDFIYRKTPLEKMQNLDIINLSQNIERNVDSIERTNNILNNREFRNSQNNKISSNFINIFMNNRGFGNISWRNNRTPSPLKMELISSPQELNDNTKNVQNKFYKLKKGRESYNNYNNALNLSSVNVNINNNPLIKSKRDLHSFKYSYSSFIKNNSTNKKINPILKKSQSIKNNINETINSISNNIKRIEYNIMNSTNSKRKLINGNYNTYNNKIGTLNESNIIHNRTNKENRLTLKKIELNKKLHIATSPNRSFRCSVLSKEANEVITDYSNSRKKISRKIVQNINFQENSKINETKCKNRTILIKDKICKKLYDFSLRNLNFSYDSNHIGKKKFVFNIKNNNREIKQKNMDENNKNNDIVEYQRNVLLK